MPNIIVKIKDILKKAQINFLYFILFLINRIRDKKINKPASGIETK